MDDKLPKRKKSSSLLDKHFAVAFNIPEEQTPSKAARMSDHTSEETLYFDAGYDNNERTPAAAEAINPENTAEKPSLPVVKEENGNTKSTFPAANLFTDDFPLALLAEQVLSAPPLPTTSAPSTAVAPLEALQKEDCLPRPIPIADQGSSLPTVKTDSPQPQLQQPEQLQLHQQQLLQQQQLQQQQHQIQQQYQVQQQLYLQQQLQQQQLHQQPQLQQQAAAPSNVPPVSAQPPQVQQPPQPARPVVDLPKKTAPVVQPLPLGMSGESPRVNCLTNLVQLAEIDRNRRAAYKPKHMHVHNVQVQMRDFWKQVLEDVHDMDEETMDFKEQNVPLKFCKDLFEAEKRHYRATNIHCDGSAVVTMSKISEIFVLEMVKRSLLSRTNADDASPIGVRDVLNAIRDHDPYDLFAEHL